MNCPSCKRLPSERTNHTVNNTPEGAWIVHHDHCTDSVHDVADAAPALLTALELFVTAVSTNGAFRPLSHELEVGRAAIAAAQGEEVRRE